MTVSRKIIMAREAGRNLRLKEAGRILRLKSCG
jgi:hypothetical protein